MSLVALQKEIEVLVAPLDVTVMSLSWTTFGKNRVLELLINRPGGVDVDLCALVSETIVETVDRYMVDEDNFYLEVASMGAEMPIRTLAEMEVAVGAWIYFELKDTVAGLHEVAGELKAVEGETVVLAYRDKTRTKELRTPFANIQNARYAVKI